LSFQKSKTYIETINLINKLEFIKAKNILAAIQDQSLKDFLFYSILGYLNDSLLEYEQAETNYLKSIKLNEEFFDAKFNLAALYYKQKKLPESEIIFLELIKKNEHNFNLYYNLGLIQFDKKDYKFSIRYFQKACSLNDKFYYAFHHLGKAYEELKQYDLAINIYKKAISLNVEGFNATHNNLGNVYLILKNYDLANKCFIQALELNGDKSLIYNNLGVLYLEIGEVEKSVNYFEKAISLNKSNKYIYSRFLATSLYIDNNKAYIKNSLAYGNNFSLNNELKNKFSYSTKEKINVGFLSSNFRQHPVGYYLLDLLPLLKSENLNCFIYSNLNDEDNYTLKLKSNFYNWNNISNLEDRQVFDIVKRDNINILIEMSGHTGDNRLPVMLHKCAPIQVSWADYLASTGLKEIDYIIGDPFVTPDSVSNQFIEKIWRLKNIWCCLSTSDIINLKPSATPALNNSFITFGSFNNLNKINYKVIEIWSSILKQVPNSKLYLKTHQLRERVHIDRIINLFKKFNISQDRLILEKDSAREESLKCYNKVDIALDTFPYNGGTTSFELSWMCVPLLVLKGNTFISKCGESINNNIKMQSWICNNYEDYIEKAVKFASNINELQKTRTFLISNSRNSTLFDMRNFSLEFSQALHQMWKDYLKNNIN
jgi:protein O-GlcNAc transferase